jgi:peroxiredoxin
MLGNLLRNFARNASQGRFTMATVPPVCDFGQKAPDFTLPATDGRTYSLADLKGERGTLVVFMCNHCPYVKAVIDRLIRDAAELKGLGVNTVAISSNDAERYPPTTSRT